jgi:hypothetical protein
VPISVETQKDGSFLTSLHIAFLSVLIALPIFSGFDIFSASRFGVFLLINVICGQYIWSRLVQERKPEVFESLAAGLAIGTSLPALINIGVRLLDLRGFHTAYIFPTLCILSWIFFDRKRPVLTIMPASEDDRDFRFIIATPFLAIVAWNPQAWPFCATYLLGTYFLYQKRIGKRITIIPSTRLFATPTILLISLIINMVYRSLFRDKPLWRYFLGTDSAWDEGAAWSVSQLGVKQNALFAGQPIRGHMLTQAWAGDLAAAITSPDFLVTGIPGFAIGALGVSFAFYATSMSIFAKRTVALTALLLLFLQASMPEELLAFPAPRYSNSLCIFYLVCVWCLLFNLPNWRIKHIHFIVFLSAVVVTLSKVHWGVVLLFSVFFLAIESLIRSRKPSMGITLINTLLAFTSTYLLFMRGAGNTEEIQITFDFFLLLSILIFIVMRILVSTPKLSHVPRTEGLRVFFVSNLLIMLLVIWLTNGDNASFYLFHTMIFLAVLFTEMSPFHKLAKNPTNIWLSIVAFSIGVFLGTATSIAYLFLRYRLVNDGRHELLYWFFVDKPVFVQPLVLLVISSVIYLLFLYAKRNQKFLGLSLLFSIISALIIGSNFGTWLVHPFKQSITNVWHDVNFDSELLFSDEQLEIGDWLRNGTVTESLIASNFQCLQSEVDDSKQSGNLNCSVRNTLSWIAPLSKRTSLLEAIHWTGGPMNSPDRLKAEEYLRVVDRFAHLDSIRSVKNLRNLGVDYVLIDKRKSDRSSWPNGGRVTYETINFYIVALEP